MTWNSPIPIIQHSAERSEPAVSLTPREEQVRQLIAEGLSNKEIAARLGVAIHTVKSHVHNVLAKLGLHTRLQVAVSVYDGANPGGNTLSRPESARRLTVPRTYHLGLRSARCHRFLGWQRGMLLPSHSGPSDEARTGT